MENRVTFNTKTQTFNFQTFNTLFNQYITIQTNTSLNQLLWEAATGKGCQKPASVPYNFKIIYV
jgi:hypothetical protein